MTGLSNFRLREFRGGSARDRIFPTATLEAPTDVESIPLLKVRNIKCLYGLHRVRAGQQYLDVENQWWIVKLYTDLPKAVETAFIENSLKEQAVSDGEIFRKLLLSKRENDRAAEKKWWARLTETKRKNLQQLLRDTVLAAAFYGLLDWPGLWTPIQLGALHRLLTLKCSEVS
ncbi:hypothetical protein H2203_005201 [Taxawa tesnikishii (nom. ined.)]|nr:hypothetical protein H2203_005201 [Dothideales sp. JES 119]